MTLKLTYYQQNEVIRGWPDLEWKARGTNVKWVTQIISSARATTSHYTFNKLQNTNKLFQRVLFFHFVFPKRRKEGSSRLAVFWPSVGVKNNVKGLCVVCALCASGFIGLRSDSSCMKRKLCSVNTRCCHKTWLLVLFPLSGDFKRSKGSQFAWGVY